MEAVDQDIRFVAGHKVSMGLVGHTSILDVVAMDLVINMDFLKVINHIKQVIKFT
jgi:hypothetical protein